MRALKKYILVTALALLPVSGAFAAGPIDMTTMNLTFSEEFSASTLDTTKWQPYYHFGSTINNELQFYTPDAVVPDALNGVLRIRADKRAFAGKNYTSGAITTDGRFAQAYGYFEMRAKLPKGKGLWPAFWLLPQDHTTPPEIDVMELLGHEINKAYLTYHYTENGKHLTKHVAYAGPDFSQDYHKFGVAWKPGQLIYYVDDVERARFEGPMVSAKPMYMLANLAVGGDWPGAPNSTTTFPTSMDIDYIRAYQYKTIAAGDAVAAFIKPTSVPANSLKTGDAFTVTATAEFKKVFPNGSFNFWITDVDGKNWREYKNIPADFKPGTISKQATFKLPSLKDGIYNIHIMLRSGTTDVASAIGGRILVKNSPSSVIFPALSTLPAAVKPSASPVPSSNPGDEGIKYLSTKFSKTVVKPGEKIQITYNYQPLITLPATQGGSALFFVRSPKWDKIYTAPSKPLKNLKAGVNSAITFDYTIPANAVPGEYKFSFSMWTPKGTVFVEKAGIVTVVK